MARVLVVDDDPDILGLVRVVLSKKGYEVCSASSGPAALSLLTGGELPDVAVIDVTMPGMSGLDLVKELRRRPETRALPVVFLSARALPDDIATGSALGARYVTKPFATSTLLEALERSLGPAETA